MSLLLRATNSILELLLIYVVLVAGAAGLYALFEQVPYGDAIWWAAVTATTTGYGDISPDSLGGRITGLFLMHATLLFILPLLIARVIGAFTEDRHRFSDEEQRQVMAELAAIRAALAARDGG